MHEAPTPGSRVRWHHRRHLVWRAVLVFNTAAWALLLLGLKVLIG